jgi:hypothetical protein
MARFGKVPDVGGCDGVTEIESGSAMAVPAATRRVSSERLEMINVAAQIG